MAAVVSLAMVGCRESHRVPLSSNEATILLFDGTGTSPGDVAAIEALLNGSRLAYSTANSSQLSDMRESRLRTYRMIVVPGGNFIEMGESLGPGTEAKLRDAVTGGTNYLGICAGAFLAGNLANARSFNLTSGVQFRFYAAEERGIRKAAVAITAVGWPTLEHYWEDGPQLSGWGAVVGRYPDGTPAIVEGTSGQGWVILSGVHPEAPAIWRRGMTFATPVSEDQRYAAALIDAALNRTWLPHE